jgi:purine-binding chemotaxis protein CheW
MPMHDNKESQGDLGNGGGRKVLTFSLREEVYGVDILHVKEIRVWSPVTRIPQSASDVLGVLNLRGRVVPIIDLRVRFALGAAQFTAVTVIIVLSLDDGRTQHEAGIVVDEVRDVIDVADASLKPVPSTGAIHAGAFIEGIATSGEQMLILLNAGKLLFDDMSSATPAGRAA